MSRFSKIFSQKHTSKSKPVLPISVLEPPSTPTRPSTTDNDSTQNPLNSQSQLSLAVQAIPNSFVGTGDQSDIIIRRLTSLSKIIEGYTTYFKGIITAQKDLESINQSSAKELLNPLNEEYLFMPLGSNGIQDATKGICDFLSSSLKTQSRKKLVVLENTYGSLKAINLDISQNMTRYNSRINPLYKNLTNLREQIEKLEKKLKLALEAFKESKDAAKVGDPFLINFELKKLVTKTLQAEDSLYKAVQTELTKFQAWEPAIMHRLFSSMTVYLRSEQISSEEIIKQLKVLETQFLSIEPNSETNLFFKKFDPYFKSPQGTSENPQKDKYDHDELNNPMLKIVKKGHLKRNPNKILNLITRSKNYTKCYSIITASGFMHCFDESNGIPTSQPDITFHLGSAIVKDAENSNIPRTTIILYVHRGTVKGSGITSKTKFSFRASTYEESIEWSKCIRNWTKISAEQLFLNESVTDVSHESEREHTIYSLPQGFSQSFFSDTQGHGLSNQLQSPDTQQLAAFSVPDLQPQNSPPIHQNTPYPMPQYYLGSYSVLPKHQSEPPNSSLPQIQNGQYQYPYQFYYPFPSIAQQLGQYTQLPPQQQVIHLQTPQNTTNNATTKAIEPAPQETTNNTTTKAIESTPKNEANTEQITNIRRNSYAKSVSSSSSSLKRYETATPNIKQSSVMESNSKPQHDLKSSLQNTTDVGNTSEQPDIQSPVFPTMQGIILPSAQQGYFSSVSFPNLNNLPPGTVLGNPVTKLPPGAIIYSPK
ncbi:hypothetical protein BB558_006067 [Smittium angustum]|uniref:SLM1/RGC1-like BAR-like domain-containing protein n=1 Tax=Smittium angustum TaxID=133377 RepID=A0A2U1IYQ7_SMIAN|nr:hypothetical protein BB558_006067 [Smittium angustum]